MNPAPQYAGGGIVAAGMAGWITQGERLVKLGELIATSRWSRHRYWNQLPPDADGFLARPTLERS